MRVKITEDSLKEEHEGQFYNLVKDDTLTVPDELGKKWVEELGWAEDVDGAVTQAERVPGARVLEVDSVKHKKTTTVAKKTTASKAR
jgi:hypothetical protein